MLQQLPQNRHWMLQQLHQSRHPISFFWHAVADVRRNHFHCWNHLHRVLLHERLESRPLVLQLRQRLDARSLNRDTTNSQRLEHFFCGLNREIRQRLDLGC